MAKAKGKRKLGNALSSIEKRIEKSCGELGEIRKSDCFPLLLGSNDIRSSLVDSVYDALRTKQYGCKRLDVIVDSGGGDIDAAYNLALLFRRYGNDRLTFIVPRWAKSAATLLTCAGDEILMTPVAELGPLDPQITAMNPMEQRVERFSPLHIDSTLQLIREEFENGNSKLAEGLMQRLQFPLTLGSFKKSLDVGREYVEKLLSSRMLKGKGEEAKKIGEILTTGYADHNRCIPIEEARELGLRASELQGEGLDKVWEIHKLDNQKKSIIQEKQQQELQNHLEELKQIPPELIDMLPPTSTTPEIGE